MGKRGPQSDEQPDAEKGFYYVPQKHKTGRDMLVPRLMRHDKAGEEGLRSVEPGDQGKHGIVGPTKPIEPKKEKTHKHKLLDESRSNIYHPEEEVHGDDVDLSEHMDEIARREHKRLGKPENRQVLWFDRLGIEADIGTSFTLQNGLSVPADKFHHEKLGDMYIIERGVTTFLFHAPKYNITKKFEKREDAAKFAENFAVEKLKGEVTRKAFNLIDKANILNKSEELQHSRYKSGNNDVELDGSGGKYSIKVNGEEVLSTDDYEAALRRYYQQVERLSGQNSEDSDISLDIFGDKVIQINREALAKLAELGNEDPKQKLLAKMNRLIKFEPPVGIIHGVQESEDVNQAVQEIDNKPSRLEPRAKYIQSDQEKGYRQSEVENKEPFFKEKVYISDEAKAPEGTKVERGPKGGIYYDSANKAGSIAAVNAESDTGGTTGAKKEKVTKKLAIQVGQKLGIDFNKLDLNQFHVGMNVELEHGTVDSETNVTNDDLILTGKITLKHIKEVPDYYTKLETSVDSEYAHLLKSNKIEKEEGMTSYIPEEFAGKKEIEQPEKVSHSYKPHEEKQDPIRFDNSMDGDEPEFYFKSEDVYDSLDEDYFSKMGVAFDANQILPSGAKTLGMNIEKNLYHSLRNSVDNWYMTVNNKSALGKAKIDLKSNLLKWQAESTKNISSGIQKIFEKGINAGVARSGVKVEQRHYGDINYQLNKSTGIIPALENFQNQVFDKISNILTKNYDKGFDVKKAEEEITSFMIDQRYRTELMVKSEVASLSHYGMLKAWDYDPEKENYRYYWKAVADSRTKPVSLIRKQGNPYTWNEINFLWKNQEQLVNGIFMNDRFFQRCGIARGKFKLDYNWSKNRFLGKENEFKETI